MVSILSLEVHDHLAAALEFHQFVGFSDFLEAKTASPFRFVVACCNIIRDSLKRNIRQRKREIPKTKLPRKLK